METTIQKYLYVSVTILGYETIFAHKDELGDDTLGELYRWEQRDESNREVNFVDSCQDAVAAANLLKSLHENE